MPRQGPKKTHSTRPRTQAAAASTGAARTGPAGAAAGGGRARPGPTGVERIRRRRQRQTAKRAAHHQHVQRELTHHAHWMHSLSMYRQLGQAKENYAYYKLLAEMQAQLRATRQQLSQACGIPISLSARKQRTGAPDDEDARLQRAPDLFAIVKAMRAINQTTETLQARLSQLERENETWRKHFSTQFMRQTEAQRAVGPLPPVHPEYMAIPAARDSALATPGQVGNAQ